MEIDVGVLVGIAGVLFAAFGYVLNRDRDKKTNATAEAETKVQLQHISQGITDIKVDSRSQQEQIRSILSDVAVVKSDVAVVKNATSSAHKRIDKLEEKTNEN